MAINRNLLELRFQNETNCKPHQAANHTTKYLKQCALAMMQDNFSHESGSRYYIYLDDLRKSLGKIEVNGKRIPVLKTFDQFPERIFNYVSKGNNLDEKLTMAESRYTLEEVLLASGTPEELAVEVYAPYQNQILVDDCDNVEIDMRSLENYIKSNINTDRSKPTVAETLDRNLKHAQKIWMLAKANNGVLCQVRNDSEFGRRYYKGPNLQNIPKMVRHAALGDCHEYDLESSVFAWKLNWFRDICHRADDYISMPATLEYLDHKDAIRRRLARNVFDTDADWAVKVIKEFITAIGFGAPMREASYKNSQTNRWQKPALSKIIDAKNRLDRALADPWIKEFVQEQNNMNTVIIGYGKLTGQEQVWRSVEGLTDAADRLKPNAVMAYLYQHAERKLLDWFEQFCEDKQILLTVHDCIYTKYPVDLMELRSGVREHGEYYNVSHTHHASWDFEDPEFVQAHRQSIAAEEARALAIYGQLTKPQNVPKPKIQQAKSDCYDGSGYTGESKYDPYTDPWFLELSEEEQQQALADRGVYVPKESSIPDSIQKLLNRQ